VGGGVGVIVDVGVGVSVNVDVGVDVDVDVEVGVGVGVGVGVDVGVGEAVGVAEGVAVAVDVAVATAVAVAVGVEVLVAVKVGTTLVGSGFRGNPYTSTAAKPVKMMAAKKAAGMKTGIENLLLGLGLSRAAPQIRQTVALKETRAPQIGQCLFSSAILARFLPSSNPVRRRCLA
jgi:hypothetical protein